MLSQFVDVFKDPEHVARIQKYFGVKIHQNKFDDDESEHEQILWKNSARKYNETRNRNQHSMVKNQQSPLQSLRFTITNHFWYYLFQFGSILGDKQFCTLFFPFWSWNIDSIVGRKIILILAIILTINLWLKDTICWPRPVSPSVVRIEIRRSEEYGMPSTHATIGFTISFGLILLTMNRYVYSFTIACIVAALWSTLVCTSRLYLGMHTLLDVFVGLGLAAFAIIPLVPLVEAMDHYVVSTGLAIAILTIISIAIVVYYPRCEDYPSARIDMVLAVSSAVGTYVGAWLNNRIGVTSNLLLSTPYKITWPSGQMLLHIVLRTVLGVFCISATKVVFRFLNNMTMSEILTANVKTFSGGKRKKLSAQNRNIVLGELLYKYVTWFVVGLNVTYSLPNVFKAIGIEGPMFHQEL